MSTLAEQLAKLGLVDKTKAEEANKNAESRWATGGPAEETRYKPDATGAGRGNTRPEPVKVVVIQPDPLKKVSPCDPPPPVDCSEDRLREWERANGGRDGYYAARQDFLQRQAQYREVCRDAERLAREKAEREALHAHVQKFVAAMEGGDVPVEVYPDSSVVEEAIRRCGALKALYYMVRLEADRGDTGKDNTAAAILSALWSQAPAQIEIEQLTDELLGKCFRNGMGFFPWAKEEIIRRNRPEQGFITPVFHWNVVTHEGKFEPLNFPCPQWIEHGVPVSTVPGPKGWYDGKDFHHGDKFNLLAAVAGRRPEGLYLHFLKGANSFQGTGCWGRHPHKGYARFFWKTKHDAHLTVGVQGSNLTDEIDRLVEACKGNMKLPEQAYWVHGEVRGNQVVASQSKMKGAILLIEGYWTRAHLQKKGTEYVRYNPLQGSERGGARVLGHTKGCTSGGAHHWTYTVVYLPEGASLRFTVDFDLGRDHEVREVSFDFVTLEPTWKKIDG